MNDTETSRRFLSSAGAATLAQATRVVVVLLANIVLRRLVPTEDWGLWGWAESVFLVLGALRDLGLPAHTLRVRPRPFGNLLVVELVWGLTLAAIVYLLAPFGSHAWADADPRVLPVLRATILFMLLEGVAAVPLHFFDGELQMGRTLAPEILRNTTYAVVAISLALLDVGVWSIVMGQIAGSAVFAALLWHRAAGRIPLHYARGETLRLLRRSSPLALSWILLILVMYVDRFILAARFSGEMLGLYTFAYWVSVQVSRILMQPVGRALYPALVSYAPDSPRRFEIYRHASVFLMCLEVPAAWFLFVNGELALLLLGGPEWVGAIGFLRLLCFAVVIDPFGRFGAELLITRGEERLYSLSLLATLVSFAGLGLLLTGQFGPIGMAWANLAPLGAVVMTLSVRRVNRVGFRQMALQLAQVFALPLLTFLPVELLTTPGSAARLIASMVALTITLAIYVWRFGDEIRGFFSHGKTGTATPA